MNDKCKHSDRYCFVRVINHAYEELPACENGVSCDYQQNRELKV